MEDWAPWDPQRAHSLNRPARAERLNRGYWDVDAVAKGRFYSSFDGSNGVQVLIDTARWRIFIHQFST
ncbi:hypothetical protein HAHE_25990 [Haloferula helveola]|uniref:Uncharacterized protein n=1 Tax=Haloferula helveola TaxID=490095 RepID=A0ABN6H4X4_9BACT|nr:hypothetical protein HAHE_06820 [Haloferula helveola]BCX48691.1 hypothetical protein HAHE_25990 [Haloferula helveola]